MLQFSAALPLSLYIHLPWCIQKCPYCDFNSHALKGHSFPEKAYIDALILDLKFALIRHCHRQIDTIFIGGGTPSLFSAKSLRRLLSAIRMVADLGPDVEISLEINPGAITREKFQQFLDLGINRFSIGVQSFTDSALEALGRTHRRDEAFAAVQFAREAGCRNLNLDLMFALPGQMLEDALSDVRQAVALQPDHLSYYQLTIEPNTVFYRYRPVLPGDDVSWEIQSAGQHYLGTHGYSSYEISAYARPDYQCRHNLNYWQFGDYLGIGAGAHSKLTDWRKGVIYRQVRHRLPERYIQLSGTRAVISKVWSLTKDELPLEFMMNSLRLTDGLFASFYQAHTGQNLTKLAGLLENLHKMGWVHIEQGRLFPSSTGLRYLNEVLRHFVPD